LQSRIPRDWEESDRRIVFGSDALGGAGALLAEEGFSPYALLTTERASALAPELVAGADAVLHVPPGKVDEISAGLLPDVPHDWLVALGGGRVIDVTKAIAGATGASSAAIPTTLSGAELTPFHRLPAGVEGAQFSHPRLVIADPALMASAPLPQLAASALNAMAHAMEALYTPAANPVNDAVALRGARLIERGLGEDAETLALGALLAAHASGSAGIAFHHALCQLVVRMAGTPHAETNAVALPHSARFAAGRAPEALASLADALGVEDAPTRLAALAALTGHSDLASLGVRRTQLPEIAAAAAEHRAIGLSPGGAPSQEELLKLLEAALGSHEEAGEAEIEVVREAFALWSQAGIEGTAERYWHEDIEWVDRPDWPEARTVRGRQPVTDHFKRAAEVIGFWKLEPVEIAAAGLDVFVETRMISENQPRGAVVDQAWFQLYRLRGGKFVRIRNFGERDEALAAVGRG
jgi:alcohol dehydrogenase class IV/ketosteroid isomerase-like protein